MCCATLLRLLNYVHAAAPARLSRFRSVRFPDPAGRAVLARASGRLSFQAGEFSATYGDSGGPYDGMFDAVVTSFFVDTAPNVVQVRFAGHGRVARPGESRSIVSCCFAQMLELRIQTLVH